MSTSAPSAPAGPDRPLFAALLIIAAMAMLGAVDNLVRYFSDALNLWQFHLLRALCALPLILLAIRLTPGEALRVRRPAMLLLRTLAVTGALAMLFTSIPLMSMAQASAGFLTSPFFVLVFSAAFLGERVGPRRILAVAAGFLGALLILQPFGSAPNWVVLLPVAGGAFYAISVILTRRGCHEETPLSIVFATYAGFATLGAIGSAALAAFPAPAAWRAAAPFSFNPWGELTLGLMLGVAGMAVASLIAITALVKAYQSAEASYLTLFEYAYILSACATAYLLFDQVPGAPTWLGVVLIVGAGGYLAMRKETSALRAPASGSPPPR